LYDYGQVTLVVYGCLLSMHLYASRSCIGQTIVGFYAHTCILSETNTDVYVIEQRSHKRPVEFKPCTGAHHLSKGVTGHRYVLVPQS